LDRLSYGFLNRSQTAKLASLATFFILASLFFVRIFIGVQGDYKDGPSTFTGLQNIEPFAIIILMLLKKRYNLYSFRPILLLIVLLIIIQGVHFFVYQLSPIAGSSFDYVIKFIKALGFIVTIFLYAQFFFDEAIFVKQFVAFTKFSIWVCIITLVAYYFFNSSFQLNINMGYPRIQAFLSEPSALAPILTSFFMISFYKKDWLYCSLSILCIVISRSPTNYLTFLVSCAIIISIKTYKNHKILVMFFFMILSFLIIKLATTDFTEIAGTMFNSDVSSISALGRLISGVEDLKAGGDLNTNQRLLGLLTVTDIMNTHNLYYIGYGLNSSSVLFIVLYDDAKDLALPISILFWYGLPGLFLGYFFIVKALISLRIRYDSFYFIFLAFVVASLINSAQGLIMYQFVFLGVFLMFKKTNKLNNNFQHH
jgi:hypothetical protein